MYCNYPGCTASLKVQFVDEDEESVVVEVDRVCAVRGGGTHKPSPEARGAMLLYTYYMYS